MEEKPKVVLVIGCRITGIQTAVNLGDMGTKAHHGGPSER